MPPPVTSMTDLLGYYARRAAEYERIYARPERQADLSRLRRRLGELLAGRDVLEAVEQGKFRIYAVGSIDEGIEVLTGVPGGQRDSEGHYPASSVNGLVEKRLREYADRLKREGGAPADRKGAEEE